MADCARSMLRRECRVKVCTTDSHLGLVNNHHVVGETNSTLGLVDEIGRNKQAVKRGAYLQQRIIQELVKVIAHKLLTS